MFRTHIVDDNEAGRLGVTSYLGFPLYGRFFLKVFQFELLSIVYDNTLATQLQDSCLFVGVNGCWNFSIPLVWSRIGCFSTCGWSTVKKMSDFDKISYDTLYMTSSEGCPSELIIVKTPMYQKNSI
jgi:hypothetical protein